MKIELEMKIKEEQQSTYDFSDSIKGIEKHKVLFSEECSSLYSDKRPEAKYEYDYEVNQIRFGEEKEEEFMYIKVESQVIGTKYIKIDPYENLYDSIKCSYAGNQELVNPNNTNKKFKANIFKRLVSKKKRRLQNEFYDLDMAYITERVIGMGFPSTGCESFYRNSLTDLKSYLDRYHHEYKIYNLCIEKKKIYQKSIWQGKKVGLFPFNDHAPCPIKLILDFCVDICLYLTENPTAVACIHCKAGKGRTGVMIVCYLIFSGLCETSDEALEHYAYMRTLNKKGVTIASQIRYIKYFETFLSANFERPFLKFIPKIIKFDLNKNYPNMILNYNTDMTYFTSINSFELKTILIGPFDSEMQLEYNFSAITRKISFPNSKIQRKIIESKFYYEITVNSDDKINYDIKLTIKSKTLKFYCWFNLWYSTFEIISRYVIKNKYFEDGSIEIEDNINRALSGTESMLEEEENEGLNKKKEDKKEEENNDNKEKKRTSNSGSIHIAQSISKNLGGNKVLNNAFSKILSKYKKKKKKKSAIKTMKNNKDLNNILDGIEEIATEMNVKILDRNNLEFTIDRKLLDKLKTKIKTNFQVKYVYKLNK